MAENFLNLGKEIDIQIQEIHKATNKINPKRSLLRQIIINKS